jgi:hypothetical protein
MPPSPPRVRLAGITVSRADSTDPQRDHPSEREPAKLVLGRRSVEKRPGVLSDLRARRRSVSVGRRLRRDRSERLRKLLRVEAIRGELPECLPGPLPDCTVGWDVHALLEAPDCGFRARPEDAVLRARVIPSGAQGPLQHGNELIL